MLRLQCPKIKKSGGPGIFFDRLLTYIQKHEMAQIVESNPDVYFATVWLDSPPKGVPIVYRAAAAYYDTKQAKRHGLNLKIAQSIRKADCVVYQSKFGKKLCEKVLNVRPKKSTIIYNGFDASSYADISLVLNPCDKMYVACADWSNPAKRGKSLSISFAEANQGKNHVLYMIGKDSEKFHDPLHGIISVGKMDIENIVAYLKVADYFVHIGYAEVCPNSVVEAIQCGCYIICNDVGGTAELISGSGLYAKCDKDFKFKRHDAKLSLNKTELFRLLHLTMTTEIRHDSSPTLDLSMERCAKEYLKVFESIL